MFKRFAMFSCSLLLSASLTFAGGSKDTNGSKVTEKDLPHDQLVAAAQAEGTLTIYTHSSRTAKAAAAFTEKYGIKVDVTQLKDSEMIEKVSKEAAADLDAADLIFCQDGSRVYPELILTGYVKNYIPPTVRGHIINKDWENPFVWEIMPKLFIANNEKGDPTLTNVWQLTEPAYKGRIQFKDPFSEGVNMNFFTMVTNDEWSKKLAQAYKELYGKELKLTTKNAGYEWIKMLFANTVYGKSDTTIAENVGAKGQDVQLYGLFTSNKLRTAKAKNLSLGVLYNVKPFTGFMYPAYAFLTKNAKSPNAAKLYLEFSMTKEGWEPFNTLGDYSAVEEIKNNKEDSYTLEDWQKELVFEDPVWCAEARSDVEEFISSLK
ncbi:MAG: substrate-binding domain-containing protein [Treponema sp.]|nr:substrate-binding domain-containing protein [Treponema sp.]